MHYTSQMMKAMYNILYIESKKLNLSSYTILFEEWAKAVNACGCGFSTEGHVKAILEEAAELNDTFSNKYKAVDAM